MKKKNIYLFNVPSLESVKEKQLGKNLSFKKKIISTKRNIFDFCIFVQIKNIPNKNTIQINVITVSITADQCKF